MPVSQNLTMRQTVALTRTEVQTLRRMAKQDKLTVSELMRKLLIEGAARRTQSESQEAAQ
jgi:predicted DNA-binding ribbon-helix-helix protein